MKRRIQFGPGIVRRAAGRPIGVRRNRERGADLVEFSLIAILFLAVLFGISDFGYALYAYHFVSTSAERASRWAAVNGSTCNDDSASNNPSDPGNPGSCTAPVTCTGNSCSACTTYGSCTSASAKSIQNYVKMITPDGLSPSKVTTTVSWPITNNSPPICNTAVSGVGPTDNAPGCTVRVKVSYKFNMLLPLVHTGSLTFSSTSEMVIAH